MAADRDGVKVSGVPEVARAIGRIDKGVRKQLGQRNKAIGQRIIDRAYPKPLAVGEGTGAEPRASAATNVLRILAGGSWRKYKVQPWGRIPTSREGVKRPYIRRSAEEDLPNIERDFLDGVLETAREVGLKVKKDVV